MSDSAGKRLRASLVMAINRLAATIENGDLLAATSPGSLLDAAREEITRLRTKVDVQAQGCADTNNAIDDCRGLQVGTKISVILDGGELVITTTESEREPDASATLDRLVTTSGTLRWHGDSCSWWWRPPPGETHLRCSNVTSVSVVAQASPNITPAPVSAPRSHGTYEVVDGVPTVWVRLNGPDGPLVPVRRERANR